MMLGQNNCCVLAGRFLTILVTRLSERFALWENYGYNEILEGGDIEEAGVLEVLDVVLIFFCFVVVRNVNGQWQVADTKCGVGFENN